MRQGRQGLFIIPHGCARRRALHGLRPGLLAIPEGLVPHLPAEGMVGQVVDLVRQAVAAERFQGLDNVCMQRPPSLLQETAVGHLVGERVLEGVGVLREEARLVQELGRLEVRQAAVQRLLGQFGNGLQQGHGHLQANDRRRLQQPLLLGRQAVDAGRQDGLYRRRHLDGRHRPRQAIGSRRADQHPGFHQGADTLL